VANNDKGQERQAQDRQQTQQRQAEQQRQLKTKDAVNDSIVASDDQRQNQERQNQERSASSRAATPAQSQQRQTGAETISSAKVMTPRRRLEETTTPESAAATVGSQPRLAAARIILPGNDSNTTCNSVARTSTATYATATAFLQQREASIRTAKTSATLEFEQRYCERQRQDQIGCRASDIWTMAIRAIVPFARVLLSDESVRS